MDTMLSLRLHWSDRLKRVVRQRAFWILAAMLLSTGLLHYVTPQVRVLPLAPYSLGRHAVERIIFLVPVAGATFAFGQVGGLVTLVLTLLIMLPRAVLMSPYPADAIIETAAVAVVGYIITWMIETQEKEKRLRQRAVSRLRALHAVSGIVTQSLELGQILTAALDKVLAVMGMEAGMVFLLDRQSKQLILTTYQGISKETAADIDRLDWGEGFCGRAAQSARPLVIQDASQDARLTRLTVRQEGLRAQICVPLQSKGRVQGVIAVATRQQHSFAQEELELITAIGNEIGVAIENARLYDNMRFYVRQITQAQEDERKRIARELHDDTIQSLIVLQRRIDGLLASGGHEGAAEEAQQRIAALQGLAADVIKDVRRFSRDLRPAMLDDLGLLPTLESLTGEMVEQDNIGCTMEVLGERRRLAPETELALFRVAQEALNNVRRHAQASHVALTVEFDSGAVRMAIEDNGQGFAPPTRSTDLAPEGKLGLMGMHERARLLGGTLEVQSQPGQGTRVVATVPIA